MLRLAAGRAARDTWAAEVAWHGLDVPRWSLRSVEEEAAAADVDEFMCEACWRWFGSVAAVKLHRVRDHGLNERALLARQCCAGSDCPHCGTDFVTRIRATRHLVHGASACVQACASDALPRVAAGTVAEAEETDRLLRARLRRIGVRVSAGMPCRGRGFLPPMV